MVCFLLQTVKTSILSVGSHLYVFGNRAVSETIRRKILLTLGVSYLFTGTGVFLHDIKTCWLTAQLACVLVVSKRAVLFIHTFSCSV